MSEDEKRGYAKGYAAGQRRLARKDVARDAAALREQFIQAMMVSIAPQMIERPWGRTIKGEWKADKGADEIMGTVRRVAAAAAENCNFDVIARAVRSEVAA